MTYVWGIIVLLVIGAFFGFALGLADKLLTVEEDSRLEPLAALLPGINCGTCGYPGCKEMAQGILKGEVKRISQCRPSRPDARVKIKAYIDAHPDSSGQTIKIDL